MCITTEAELTGLEGRKMTGTLGNVASIHGGCGETSLGQTGKDGGGTKPSKQLQRGI